MFIRYLPNVKKFYFLCFIGIHCWIERKFGTPTRIKWGFKCIRCGKVE